MPTDSFMDFIDGLTAGDSDIADMRATGTKAAFKRPTQPLRRTAAVAPAKRVDPLEAFDEQEPGLREFLRDAASWSDFAASLHASLVKWKTLTAKQLAAAQGMRAKVAARQEAKTSAAAVTLDLSPIKAMFDRAVTAGLKTPTYRADGLTISRAPDTGRNPGALYVKRGSDYMGKIVGTSYSGQPEVLPTLQAIAVNPLEAAVAYGRKTGTCSCCGRHLDNPESVALGIGPICRGKYF